MNPFEMVVLIVLILGIVRIVQARHGLGKAGRRWEGEVLPTPGHDDEAERLRAELRQVKDRLAVLERIVTDGDRSRGLELEREIEALRGERELRR